MRLLPPVLAALVALAAAPALAQHTPEGRCDSGNMQMGVFVVSDGTPGRTFYVDDRNLLMGNGIWIYEESNGIWSPGDPAHSLQRGGSPWWTTHTSGTYTYQDPCVDDPLVLPDRLWY